MPNTPLPSAELPLDRLRIAAPFWQRYQRLVQEVVLPYQWDALNDAVADAAPSHAIENFRIAAGRSDGTFYGMVFQDSDVAKWLEAVAYLLAQHPDPVLERNADATIELIGAAQQADGYLNTYFTVKAPEQRWTNLAECHELYCAGHMIEAGVAYHQATGKRTLLDIVCRLADHIDATFGPGPTQLHGYPGHPEIELALMRLYEATSEPRYLALARYFVEQRGRTPHYYDIEQEQRGGSFFWDAYGPAWMIKDKAYSQAHLPVALQDSAVGHAVRFAYLYTGVAHLARHSDDVRLRAACERLWNNATQRQMYLTGAIGAQSHGEAFSVDYDLPSDTAYNESCASIGLMMFAKRMLQLAPDSRYADVMERALYNTVLAGMALDGRHFFYVNPLEVQPATVHGNHTFDHVKPVRQRWFGCACCPPNIARVLTSLGHYIYTRRDDALYVNLYVGSDASLEVHGQTLTLQQRGDYPWQEQIELRVDCATPIEAALGLRLPDWCRTPQLRLNGEPVEIDAHRQHGYCVLRRHWQQGDTLHLHLPMPAMRVSAHPRVRHLAGKVALQRGPLVYCLEQADNGAHLQQLRLPATAAIHTIAGSGALAGQVLLQAEGERLHGDDSLTDTAPLYRYDAPPPTSQPQTLTFVPYFAWANRGEGEMRVWMDAGGNG
ncbi:beta-L-arabinofuranosidase domain-containing protein [Xanthomonas sp. GPE 39]|uniref:glycoside hydrolase family 127 protein n=1 Tax=Xanthomonas sp. GPE 39 TaxID=1583099 RepID=UPI0005F2F76E|nr:beta-L-arabinofuranosidase domain-containing protein [Xanthomonas sp. GPE 39]